MIELFEQYGYKRSGYFEELTDKQKSKLGFISRKSIFMEGKGDVCCVNLDFDETRNQYHFETNYFVGIDWLIENKQAVYVQPKMNNEKVEVDYISMLKNALEEPDNLNHLIKN